MSSRDPSLLPDDMRGGKEEGEVSRTPPTTPLTSGGDGFHVPGAAMTTPAVPPPQIPILPPLPSPPAPIPIPTTPTSNGRRNGKQASANGNHKKNGTSKSTFSAPPPMSGKAFRGITLIPDDLRSAVVAGAWVPGIAIAGILFAVLLIAVPWFVLEARTDETRSVVEALETRHENARKRAAIAEQDLASYRRTIARAGVLRELLAQHRSWSAFFALIEAGTLPTVRYDGVTADVAGSVILPASAPSIRAAAEQIKAWQEAAEVSDVEMSGISSSTDALGVIRGARFDVQFLVDPHVFVAPSARRD
ncbi:MAG: hypothetical protein Q7S02_03655 [bacterium]|nr:hypothetical protein [bacterium]